MIGHKGDKGLQGDLVNKNNFKKGYEISLNWMNNKGLKGNKGENGEPGHIGLGEKGVKGESGLIGRF